MMTRYKKQRLFGLTGQAFVEYAVIIAVICAALLGMRIYVKRAMMGKMRQSAEEIGSQYSPKSTSATTSIDVTPSSVTTPTLIPLKNNKGVAVTDIYGLPVYGIETTTVSNETTNRTHTESVGPYEASFY
jgi:Flp pilus assembly pilin Flp